MKPSSFPPGIAGEVEGDGPGAPLLWAHGLTASREDEERGHLFRWTTDRRVIRWDAPGHGRSDPAARTEDLHWSRLGRLMVSVADALGVDRFVAGGASMGAATSLWAAVTAPERLAALLLVVPPTAWETRAGQADIYQAQADLLEKHGVSALADESEDLPLPPLFGPVADQVRAARRASLLAADPANLATVLRGAAASDLPPREEIARIRVPSLVLAWDGDPGHPRSTAEALAGLLPQAELRVASDLRSVLGWNGVVGQWLNGLL